MNKFLAGFISAAALAGLAACNNGGATPVTAPTTTTTTTLTGTVQAGGSDFQTFTTAAAGEIDVALTAAGPPSTITMGIALGNVSADLTSCTPNASFAIQSPAGTTPQLAANAPAGTYCVVVADVGNAAGAIAYTVVVTHV
jgi:hypothetical protein